MMHFHPYSARPSLQQRQLAGQLLSLLHRALGSLFRRGLHRHLQGQLRGPLLSPLPSLLTLLLLPLAPAQAAPADNDPCQAEAALGEIEALLNAGKELRHVFSRLDQVMACPEAAYVAELNVLSAVGALLRGDIPLARQLAEQAQRLSTGEEQRRASELSQLLDRGFSEVTFASNTEQSRPNSLSLEQFSLDLEGERASLEAALGTGLSALATGAFEQSVEAQRPNLEARGGPRSAVWLPRGTYRMSSGQKLVVGGGDRLTVYLEGESDRTFNALASMMVLRSLSPRTLVIGSSAAYGVQIGYAHRLASRYFLRLGFGLYPLSSTEDVSDCVEAGDGSWLGGYDTALACATSRADAHLVQTLGLGAAMQRPINQAWTASVGAQLQAQLSLGDAVGVPEVWVATASPRVSLSLGPELELRYSLYKRFHLQGELQLRLLPLVGMTLYVPTPTGLSQDAGAETCSGVDGMSGCLADNPYSALSAWHAGGSAGLGMLFYF